MVVYLPTPKGGVVEKLLSRQELSALLGIPLQTLNNWASTGVGPKYVRIGRHARYRPADVEAWLETRAKDPAPAQ